MFAFKGIFTLRTQIARQIIDNLKGKVDYHELQGAIDTYMIQYTDELLGTGKSGKFKLSAEAEQEIGELYWMGSEERRALLDKADEVGKIVISKIRKDGGIKSELNILEALEHLKTRKASRRKKGIVGCHDDTVFFNQNVIRSVDATKISDYSTEIGKIVDQVEEIVIINKTSHSKVPGVTIVEYKIPSLSNTNPPLTTGQLATPSNGGIKTLYDPKLILNNFSHQLVGILPT